MLEKHHWSCFSRGVKASRNGSLKMTFLFWDASHVFTDCCRILEKKLYSKTIASPKKICQAKIYQTSASGFFHMFFSTENLQIPFFRKSIPKKDPPTPNISPQTSPPELLMFVEDVKGFGVFQAICGCKSISFTWKPVMFRLVHEKTTWKIGRNCWPPKRKLDHCLPLAIYLEDKCENAASFREGKCAELMIDQLYLHSCPSTHENAHFQENAVSFRCFGNSSFHSPEVRPYHEI